MKQSVKNIFEDLFRRYPGLELSRENIEKAFDIMKECFYGGGKILVCGNGGSAADSEHIVGELMKGFMLKRRIDSDTINRIKESFPEDWKYLSENLQGALPAISLVSQSSLSTAFSNDVAADMVYAQQVYGYGRTGDVLIALSTSGNSGNVVKAIQVASALKLRTIGLTGIVDSRMTSLCDVVIQAPESETYKVQEYHLPIYHALCAMIESEFFG